MMPLRPTEAQIYYLHLYFLKSPFVTHENSIIERVFFACQPHGYVTHSTTFPRP